MTDAEWQVVRAVLPVPAWLEGRGGRPESYCHRVMLDAVRYVVDNGVKWANLPADFRRTGGCTPSPAAGR
ncbi:transposase [Streptomyces sp. NPDC004227]